MLISCLTGCGIKTANAKGICLSCLAEGRQIKKKAVRRYKPSDRPTPPPPTYEIDWAAYEEIRARKEREFLAAPVILTPKRVAKRR